MAVKYIGVDVGGTNIKIGFFDQKMGLIEKNLFPTSTKDNGSYIISDIVNMIEKTFQKKQWEISDIEGIGLGIPGPVDKNGVVEECVNLGWKNIHVKQEIEKYFDANIYVGNDANVAALGESLFGSGEGLKNVVFLTLGTGVGGGVIVNGNIIEGENGAGGELGHLTVEYTNGKLCNCGKTGCLEQYASATGLVNLVNNLAGSNIVSDTKTVFKLAQEGSAVCKKAIDSAADYLARGLTQISCVIDPSTYVIGGGLAEAGNDLLEPVRSKYKDYAFFSSKNTEIRQASLGNDAGIYGCAAAARKGE